MRLRLQVAERGRLLRLRLLPGGQREIQERGREHLDRRQFPLSRGLARDRVVGEGKIGIGTQQTAQDRLQPGAVTGRGQALILAVLETNRCTGAGGQGRQHISGRHVTRLHGNHAPRILDDFKPGNTPLRVDPCGHCTDQSWKHCHHQAAYYVRPE